MDAVEKTLTYRDDTVLYGKRLPTDQGKYPPKTQTDEPNYVDLVDMKSDGTKPVKGTFPGEADQPDFIQRDISALAPNDFPGKGVCDCKVNAEDFPGEYFQDRWFDMTVTDEVAEEARLLGGNGPDTNTEPGGTALPRNEHDPRAGSESICSRSDDMEYTDMYLNSKTESDHDDESEGLSEPHEPEQVEDESHYITTHEIQLTELDHDVDYDHHGRGDCEDDNLVYTFVDYALFESDETQGDSGCMGIKNKTMLNITHEYKGAAADAGRESDSDNSSDESVFKNECVNTHQERLIHLSIKPAARTTEDSSDNFSANGNACGHVQPAPYRGRFLTNINPRGCDFIPAPGRQHLATKLRWKDVNSSGASSSISELDDADKEVRNLTSKTFRSLACPYFDAINMSTSSESSMSEYGLGLNKWSAFVNLNHGNISQHTERGVFARKSSSAMFALNNAADSKTKESNPKTPQTKFDAANKNEARSKQPSSSSNITQAEQPQRGDVFTLTETINFQVEAELPESTRQSKCSKGVHGSSRTKEGVAKGNTQKRATFASSHLKNVISKKMQFENDRQLEMGDLASRSPCSQCREQEHSQGRGLHRQSSESGSEFTVNSLDEIGYEGMRPHSCETREDEKKTHFPERGCIENLDPLETHKAGLNHSQCSAFTLLRGEVEAQKAPQGAHDTAPATAPTEKEAPDGSGVGNKLSHLFVPSSLRLSKEKDSEERDPPGAAAQSGREPVVYRKEEDERVAKPPEIKIRLRAAKENKGHMLNIANLLTPEISNTVKTLKTAGYSRLQVLSAPDRMPHFTVRDVRENKCKFQAPIYHVRDVRKLVKSSYGFVTADNADNRCPASAPAAAAEGSDDTGKRNSIKHVSPSPIFIKCNSVKTNSDGKPDPATAEPSPPKPPEASRFSPRGEGSSSHWAAYKGTPAAAKPPHLDPPRQDRQTGDGGERKNDPKVPNQAALEKLQAAVKTMEQLYVFDRNEWKRKGHAPQPVSNSHVLSLIASEEHGAEEIAAATGGRRSGEPDAITGGRANPSMIKTGREKESKGIVYVPVNRDPVGAQPQLSKTYCKKSVLHLDPGKRQSRDLPPGALSQASCSLKSAKTQGAPQLVKIAVPKDRRQVELVRAADSGATVTPAHVDPGNYLTIPRQGYTSEIKLLPPPPNATGDSPAAQPQTVGSPSSPLALQTTQPHHGECSSASIFHHHHHRHHSPAPPAPGPPQPHLPRPSPSTQRKMLLDLTTGFYYLVDTPLQPATKRLFDPETGHYVDVPMSHTPVTPIPLSPLTLSPGVYTPTYMMYPGPIPPSPAHADTPGLPEAGHTGGPSIPPTPSSSSSSRLKPGRQQEAGGAESPYYSATGEATDEHVPPPTHVNVPNPSRTHLPTLRLPGPASAMAGRGGGRGGAQRKPVISITSQQQQGPRIIAPPSFDGTTMSFVVEHR
ncbi:uncharacterized protein C4orf54-like [Gadus chalcogrammus]|uniref:uncharacterized protein C4orf54-like n=1 Tax=Gadus chalcogrammus TaxID=1042646 RepID=UPI0024C3DD89|nr:uncharacterized protein C4orf54-like [Gadus chalcogrammus]